MAKNRRIDAEPRGISKKSDAPLEGRCFPSPYRIDGRNAHAKRYEAVLNTIARRIANKEEIWTSSPTMPAYHGARF